MIHCEMCGIDVPPGAGGRCFIGHALAPTGAGTPITPAASTEPRSLEPLLDAAMVDPPAPDLSVLTPMADPIPAPLFSPPTPLGSSAPLISPAPEALTLEPLIAPHPLVASTPPPLVAPAAPPPLVAPASLAVSGDAPVLGTAALDLHRYAEPATSQPASSARDLFIVPEQRSGSPRVPRVAVMAIAGVIAIVALLGWKITSSGSSDPQATLDAPVAAPPGKARAQSRVLQRAFITGQASAYTLDMKMRMTMEADGHSQDVDAAGVIGFTESVIARGQDGSTTLRYSFDRIEMTIDGHRADLPKSGATAVRVTIGPDGTIRSVLPEGSELPGEIDTTFFRYLAPVLPKGAKPGEAWSRTDKVPLGEVGGGQHLTVTSRFRILRLQGANAVVASQSDAPFDLVLDANAIAQAFGGSSQSRAPDTLRMRGRMISDGVQTVDVASGRTLEATGRGTMTMAFEVDGRAMMQMKVAMQMTLRPNASTPPGSA